MAKRYPAPPARPKNKLTPVKQRPSAPVKKAAPVGRWEPAGWLKWALLAMAITAACYLPSLSNDLVNWDDDPNITENPNLERIDRESLFNIFDLDKGNVIGNYNPLPIFTFYLEKWAVGEINPTLIHFNNLLLHVLTVFFVFRVLLHIGIGIGGAFVGGLLFGIHPMRVESVAWATERKDVLFAVFFFAALMYYVRWIKTEDTAKRTALYLGMVLLAILSGFSKVQAVTLPLSMLALDYWFRRPINLGLIWEKTPFWIISLLFGLANLYTLRQAGSIQDDVTHFNFLDRLCIGTYSFSVYLYKLFIPYPMSPLYPYPKPLPIWVYLSPLLFAAVWYGVYRAWKADRRIWVFGMLFFFFNVMFLLQVLGAGQGFLADRFTYVPYFGFFAIAAWLYHTYAWPSALWRPRVNAALGVLFAIYAVWTVRQIGIWKNGGTLWTHVMKYENRRNSLPYWNRGQYLRNKEGKYEAALEDYTTAITIEPDNPELTNSRGKTYFDMATSGKYKGRERELTEKALADFTSALSKPKIKPKTKAEVLINRGAALSSMGRLEEALADLDAGIALAPDNKNGYLNRSLTHFHLQRYDKAIEDYTKYLELDPYAVNIWYERGMLRRSLNRPDEAIADLNRCLQLDPNFALAYLERARAYALKRQKDLAQQDYLRAQQMGLQLSDYDRQLMK
jgi:tetratricopeptide (TPR) repeat protein